MAKVFSATSIKMKGDMLFARTGTGGVDEGLYPIANVTEFSMQPQATTDTINGTELDNYGQTLDSLTEADDFLVTVTANRFNGRSLALALLGNETEISTGTTAVTEEVCRAWNGTIHLARQNIVAASVVIRGKDITVDDTTGFAANTVLTNNTTGKEIGLIESVPDGTSLIVFMSDPTATITASDVVGDGTNTATVSSSVDDNTAAVITTDFTEDTTNGRVTVVSSGSLDKSLLEKVVVNYTYNNETGSQVALGAETVIKGRLVLKGINLVTNKRVHVDLRQVNMAPNSAIPLMGDDRSEITFNGVAETPSGQSDPGTIDVGA